MAITVTATPTGAKGATLRVLVLTGAVESGGNNAGPAGNTGGTVSFTPNFSNSFVAWANNNEGNNGAFTAIANNTILDNIAGTNGTRMATGYYTGTVTAHTALTAGATGASTPTTTAVYEVPASGASPPSIDASSPPVADETSGSAALTTASFSPPASAVIEAILTASNFPSGWTVSSTPSLTWSKRADNGNGQQIWTATAPAGGNITAAGGLQLAGLGLAGTAAEVFAAVGGLQLGPLGLAGSAAETITAAGGLRLGPLGLAGQASGGDVTAAGGLRLARLGLAAAGSSTQPTTAPPRPPRRTIDDPAILLRALRRPS